MVQQTLANLKEGPKEDKVAVAGGIAVSVVVVLLVVWAVFFLRGLRDDSDQLNLSSGAQDQFNPAGVKEAQQQIQENLTTTNELLDIRARASGSGTVQQEAVQQQLQGDQSSPFKDVEYSY